MVDIPNAFAQTVVEDDEHCVIVCIRGPLVDILTNIAPHVDGPYVLFNKSEQKVFMVQCLNALYGTMVAALLHYKRYGARMGGTKNNTINLIVRQYAHLKIMF